MNATLKKFAMIGGSALLSTGMALATPIISNDTFEGLPSLGTQVGDFLTNLTPGVIAITFGLAIVSVVVMLFLAVATRIKGSLGGSRHR